jgi:hypothetical protein
VGVIGLDGGIESVQKCMIWRSCAFSTARHLSACAPHTTGTSSDNTVQWEGLSQAVHVH